MSDYAFFPRKYLYLNKKYEQLRDSFWVPAEIDFTSDRNDWINLSNEKDPEKLKANKDMLKFIEHILAFFAQADGIVNENLIKNFENDTEHIKEAGDFYKMQAANETIHSETYGIAIETLITNSNKKQKMYDAIMNYPSIKKISEWVFEYMDPKKHSLPERIVGFCCVEGILFTSAFCAIYWLKKKKIFRGLWKANEFIARDEAVHTEFGVLLYHHFTSLTKEYEVLNDDVIKDIIGSAVDVTSNFTHESLQVDLIGMSPEEMILYIKSTANSLGKSLGLKDKIYNVENPFDWMAVISLPNKTNFFEDEVSEYSKVKFDASELVEIEDF